MNRLVLLRSLRNPIFARLYTAQTTSLLGDALTWVGLALLVGRRFARTTVVFFGAVLITLALLPANYANLPILMCLWLLAGAGQNCVNLPTQTLIADRIPTDAQGRVYGTHFAWSHLWWAISYPASGWLGSHFVQTEFIYGSLIGFVLLAIVQILFHPYQHSHEHSHYPVSHSHEHIHDEHHHHEHPGEISLSEPHAYYHSHVTISFHCHSHSHTDIHHRHSH